MPTPTVTRDVQALPITAPVQQGTAHIADSGTALDGMDIQEPFVILLDEKDPSRQVSPADEVTLQAILTLLGAQAAAGTADLSSFNADTVSHEFLPPNGARLGAMVTNDSPTATLFLAYEATATPTAYSVKMPPGAVWEMPLPVYRGAIAGIWDLADGAARVTELTA